MTLLLGAAAGFLVARGAWRLLRPVFSQPPFLRPNYRGRAVPTAAGVVLPLALVVVEAARVAASALAGKAARGRLRLPPARSSVVVVVVGLALLGLVDDLAGSGDVRGFRGHLAALRRGRLTTGGAKLAGGVAVAVVAVAPLAGPSAARLAADAALVALSANLANLFDRRPGRLAKVGLVSGVALAAATGAAARLGGVAVVAGAVAGLGLDDLHERLMLGDAGANALGGALGLGVVLTGSFRACLAALVVVAALNLASEAVSFSRVIDAVPPLRALDRAGRLRA